MRRPACVSPRVSDGCVRGLVAPKRAFRGGGRSGCPSAEHRRPADSVRRRREADLGIRRVGYKEQKSSALLQEQLRAAGFTVRSGVADIPTAFVASFGSGKPVIGILGEYDALPGLSQGRRRRGAPPSSRTARAMAAGTICWHRLAGSAIAVKEMAAGRPSGNAPLYGTPAEEGGSGKVYMVRAGLFSDVDAVVSWHPADRNDASPSTNLANITGKFRFRGVAAHAAAAPEKGRSALDAVEAMDYMVNMMREHVPQETRIHYIITRGGAAPNVVPDFAEASCSPASRTCASSTPSGSAWSTPRKAPRWARARRWSSK